MDWTKLEVAELDAYTPWTIIAAPVLGGMAALLIADGLTTNSPVTLIVGSVLSSGLGAYLILRFLGPVPTEFLEAIASADWCPDAREKLKELANQHGRRLSLRHYRIVEKIQKRRDFELAEKKDRTVREKALDAIRSRK